MRIFISLLLPLLALSILTIFSVESSIIIISFFLLIPISYFIRNKIFIQIEKTSQTIFSIGYGLYLFNIILYVLDFDDGRTIMKVISVIYMLSLIYMIIRVLREKPEDEKRNRKTELGYMYLVFNFAWLLNLLSIYHKI